MCACCSISCKQDVMDLRSSPHQELCFLCAIASAGNDACVDGKAFSSSKSNTSCSCNSATLCDEWLVEWIWMNMNESLNGGEGIHIWILDIQWYTARISDYVFDDHDDKMLGTTRCSQTKTCWSFDAFGWSRQPRVAGEIRVRVKSPLWIWWNPAVCCCHRYL